MERLLLKAVQTRQKVEIIYLDRQHKTSQRVIKMLRVSHGTVTAFCFTRNQIRTFKKDQILSIQPYDVNQPGA